MVVRTPRTNALFGQVIKSILAVVHTDDGHGQDDAHDGRWGPLWTTSCDNAFSDAVPVFVAGIEFLTGLIPVYIDGPQREDRKDILGLLRSESPKVGVSGSKPFPIKIVTA